MRNLFKFSIAAIAAGTFILVGASLHAMDITTEKTADIKLDINGFMTISPGILFIDAADFDDKGDPDVQFPEISSEARIQFTFGTDTFKITGSQWTRDDAIICRNVGTPSATGKKDCELRLVYLDWDPTDSIHVVIGRGGNRGNHWNHRTCIWETFMGWTPVLPSGCYFMHLEGNDIIDVQFALTDALTIGINAREEPGISALGANVGPDTFATAGNVEHDCATDDDNCGQSLMLGPTVKFDLGPGRWIGGTFQIENQTIGPDHDNTEDLSHTGLMVNVHWSLGDRGGKVGAQLTQLNVEQADSSLDDTEVTDLAVTLLIAVGDGPKITANINSVTWTRDDANGGDRDDLYFDVGFQDDAFGPGQRVGISYRSLAIALDNDSDDDHAAAVLELSFWQGF